MTVSQDIKDQLDSDSFSYCHLIKMDLNGLSVHLTEAQFDIEYKGVDYLGNGLLLDVSSIRETSEIRVNSVNIEFTAADQTMLALLLNNSQISREVLIYRAYLDDENDIISEPTLLTWGNITGFSTNTSMSDSIISLTFAGPFADWERINGRVTTAASQNRFYPNDKGMEYATQVKAELKWGGK